MPGPSFADLLKSGGKLLTAAEPELPARASGIRFDDLAKIGRSVVTKPRDISPAPNRQPGLEEGEPVDTGPVTTGTEAYVSGAGDGLTSWLGEGAAAMNAVGDTFGDTQYDPHTGEAMGLGDRYEKNLASGDRAAAVTAKEHPVQYALGRVTGTGAQQAGLAALTGGQSLTPWGQAIVGGVEGAGAAGPGHRLSGAEDGALVGGTMGAAFQAAPIIAPVVTSAYLGGTAALDSDLTPAERIERGIGAVATGAGAVARGVSNSRNGRASTASHNADAAMNEALTTRESKVRDIEPKYKKAARDVGIADDGATLAELKKADVIEQLAGESNKTYQKRLAAEDKTIGARQKAEAARAKELSGLDSQIAKTDEEVASIARTLKGRLGRGAQMDYDAYQSMYASQPEDVKVRLRQDPAIAARLTELETGLEGAAAKRFTGPKPQEQYQSEHDADVAAVQARREMLMKQRAEAAAKPVEVPEKGPKTSLVSKERAAEIAAELKASAPPPEDSIAYKKAALDARKAQARAADAKAKSGKLKKDIDSAIADTTPESVRTEGNAVLEKAKVLESADGLTAKDILGGPKRYLMDKITSTQSPSKAALNNPAARAVYFERLADRLKTNRGLVKYLPLVDAGNVEELARAAAKDPELGAALKDTVKDTNERR